MITVFYDGNCGLCKREITTYKRMAQPDIFEWVDITQTPQPLLDLGFSQEDGLKALHLKDSNDKVSIGVDAFIVIWQQLSIWKFLALLVKLPFIYPIIKLSYAKFAEWRFKKLGYGQCAIK